MKITRFEAENFKRLRAVSIAPRDGALVKIEGENSQGKTSCLEGIAVALGGKHLTPATPIRRGQQTAAVSVELSDGTVVVREFRRAPDGGVESTIRVRDPRKGNVPKPQGFLDGLRGAIWFDPLAFTRLKEAEQFDVLRQFVPGVNFDEIERADKTDREERTAIGRLRDRARGAAASIPIPDVVPREIDTEALTAQLADAAEHNDRIRQRQAKRREASARIEEIDNEIETLEARMASLRREADGLQKKLDEAEELPSPIDVESIRRQLAEAQSGEAARRQIADRQRHLDEATAHARRYDELTEAIEQRQRSTQELIAKARMPIDGLSLDGRTVTLNGLPFSDASGAEKLRTSVAIGMAMNPTLRVMLIDEASSLDDHQLAALAQQAAEADYQLWLVRVGTDDDTGFIIEDGSVVHVPA